MKKKLLKHKDKYVNPHLQPKILTLLSVIDRMGRQKISKNIKYFNFIEYKTFKLTWLSFTENSTQQPYNIY